ncbi:hypothetical protein DMH26_28610 [Streptomyces sp. WAC 05379]|uniref:hypothetical protein n=1 Tax=Streptomyces sp. WAC 05379 TaxID=2203207 RepID=UPI000F7470F4|nr:hypothetical protein [Streptomyces sp. WAC 05379]RSN90121.1 hypothetical protein DMH26_28610 [Streptomyces sp. WAC 05379]
MTKSHGRKSRARKTSRTRGAAYAAANAGTLHQHDGGPSAEYLQPADPSRWGVDAAPDMRTASALIGARIEQCAPCQGSLTTKLLDEEPIVLAVTAAAVYALHSDDESTPGGLTSKAAQAFAILVQQTREQAEPELLPWGVSLMSRADRAALLEDTLDLWAHYGSQPLERRSRSRGADLLGLDHLGTYGVPTNMTPKETPMNERLEDHAESAARSLVALVNALHRQGLQYPAEAYHIYSFVTGAAAEMRNVLDLIEGSIREMNAKDRLRVDRRGGAVEDVVRRFTESSSAAQELATGLADQMGKAYSAVGHLAYKEAPGEQEAAAGN